MELFVFLFSFPFVCQCDLYSFVKECHFTQTTFQCLKIIFRFIKNFRIRPERALRSRMFRSPYLRQRSNGLPFFVFLFIYFTVSFYFNLHVSGKCIYDRCTYPVKSSGYFISSAAEFTSGMQNGMNYLYCRYAQLRMFVYRHTSSVIFYSDGIIFVYRYMDRAAKSSKSFVDTVVYHFIHQMVKTPGTCTSDVHTGSFSYSFKTF